MNSVLRTNRNRSALSGGKERPRDSLRVLHVLPALSSGGMERATIRLMTAASLETSCIAPFTSIEHGLCLLGDADKRLLEVCRPVARIWILGQSGPDQDRLVPCWWRLRRVIRQFRPHVVHARSTGVWSDAACATLGTSTQLVLGFHGLTDLNEIAWRRRLVNRWSAGCADAVVAVSRESARMMEKEWAIPAGRVLAISNGVDLDRYHPACGSEESHAARRMIGLTARDLVVTCVANLMPIKSIDVLLRAWRQVSMAAPCSKLLLIGEGPMRNELERLTGDLRCGGTVRFVGHREDIPALLRLSDAFVLPSRYEACSNAILEAMATGLPVIACRTGGNPDLVEHGRTGWLVPPGQSDQLAEALLALLLDGPARQRLGRAARAAAEQRFSERDWVDTLLSLYSELSARDPARAEVSSCAG